ncbi:MAG: hypothetical protein KBF88_17775, partial [Polyangiaceae bacterium]|nr:hypothetical protein [Polyangiaceae bacterium]
MSTKFGRSPSTASVTSLRRLTIFSGAMLSLLGAACSSSAVEDAEELGVEGTPGILKVVEVLRKGDHPFIELRNDGDQDERGSDNAIRISSSTEKLVPIFGFADVVPGHG